MSFFKNIFKATSFNALFKICLGTSLSIFSYHFFLNKTDGFSILAISSKRPFDEKFSTKKLSLEEETILQKALSQPYYYYGCGGQAFAFFSADGAYVIKFFKQRLFRPPCILNALPLPKFLHRYRQKRNWKRRDKLERDFFSYKVAFELLQEQTGVIYAHLQKTKNLKQPLEIIDRLHIHHKLNLNKFDFIVQKRAEKVYDRIDFLIRTKNVEEAQNSIKEIFRLIITRAQLGFRDRDPNIRTNCGFIGNRAVKIDVGRFVFSETIKTPEKIKQDVTMIIKPFKDWVEKTHPELLPWLLQEYENAMDL